MSGSSRPGEMSNSQLFQQLALLGWLRSDSEKDKEILTAITGIQVARELMNRLTGQREVDAFKIMSVHPAYSLCPGLCLWQAWQNRKECIQSIADFVQKNPRASQKEINTAVEKHVLLFAARVQALDSAPLL
uniref:Uncharacterized protein n=1 Tax=Oncorhynchus tshawytscha TaxID=74940 RepID=A0A8C8EXA8_ONCTS